MLPVANKPRTLAVRVVWTVLLGAREEYVVPGNTHFRSLVEGEV